MLKDVYTYNTLARFLERNKPLCRPGDRLEGKWIRTEYTAGLTETCKFPQKADMFFQNLKHFFLSRKIYKENNHELVNNHFGILC